jgi:hypothetical protein
MVQGFHQVHHRGFAQIEPMAAEGETGPLALGQADQLDIEIPCLLAPGAADGDMLKP